MKRILIGLCALCALSSLTGLAPQAASQSVTIVVSPETDESYWVWSDEYECWVWNGPEFQGDYQGHPYAYWHGRHEGGGDRDHRPSKGGNVEPAKGEAGKPNAEQPKPEVPQTKEEPKAEGDKPKTESEKPKEEQPKAEEKGKAEKPKTEEKAKAKPEEKKDDSKPKGE
jgi:hypothetical protein